MKILKPGKVEQRKFVCPNCECEFVIYKSEAQRAMDLECRYHYWAQCPCRDQITWEDGEPYEEPVEAVEPDRKWVERLVFEQLGGKRNYSPLLTDYFLQNSGPGKEK